jgi:branched-chain amino acid transport system permease protein
MDAARTPSAATGAITPWYVPAGFACLIVAYPFLANDYFIAIAFYFGVYALLGLGLNIVLGEVGLFDLGHAGFYAIGAYVTAVLNTRWGIPVLALLPVSCLAAALFAYIVCSPIIHLKGDYLCIVTIGMGEIVRIALINNPFDLTGGPNGVFGIDFPRIGDALVIDSSIEYYFLVWSAVGISIAGLVSPSTPASAGPGTASVRMP